LRVSVERTLQTRATELSATRCASLSVSSGVVRRVIALPKGFSGPIGTRWRSSSSMLFATPSTVMSSRAEKRCW
jgi:hypothetical protein